MTNISDISIVERDISRISDGKNDARKKVDKKCKLTEHSYINACNKVDMYKQKNREIAQEVKNFESQVSHDSSISEVKKEEIDSAMVQLKTISEIYKEMARDEYKKVVEYRKSKALRMSTSMLECIIKKYNDAVDIEQNKIDINDINFDAIKQAVDENLANATFDTKDTMKPIEEEMNMEEISNQEPLKSEQSSIYTPSFDTGVVTPSIDINQELSHNPVIPEINDYEDNNTQGYDRQEIGTINEDVFSNSISEPQEFTPMSYESNVSEHENSSLDDLTQIHKQLQAIAKERDKMIKLREETLIREATEARELADEQDKTRRAIDEVNHLIDGISSEISQEQERVSESQGKIERYTKEKQKEIERQRMLSDMVGAYSTNAQNVSRIGTNFVSVDRGRMR